MVRARPSRLPNAISAPAALGRLDEQRAEPVAIAAEILVAALRDDRLLGRLDHQPRPGRIGLQAVAEALIGEIDEGDEAARGDDVRDRAPLVHVEIGAGRIVAAAVQQDEIAAPPPAPSASIIRSKRIVGAGFVVIGIRRPSRRRPRRSAAHGWARSARRHRCGPADWPGRPARRRAAARRSRPASAGRRCGRRAAAPSPNTIGWISSVKRASPCEPI